MGIKKNTRMPAEDRRKQIMDTALHLFAKNGFEDTKTRTIAEAAGISEAAMFKLFRNKEELITKSLEYKFACHHDDQKKTFLASLDMEKLPVPDTALRDIGLKAFEMIEQNIDLVRVTIYSIMKHPDRMRKYLKDNMKEDDRIFKKLTEKGIKNGMIKNMDTNIIGPVFPIMMLGLAIANYLIEGKISTRKKRENFVSAMVEIYLRGILK